MSRKYPGTTSRDGFQSLYCIDNDSADVTSAGKAMSTLATIVAEFGDCRQKRRLSPNSATNCRQCGHGLNRCKFVGRIVVLIIDVLLTSIFTYELCNAPMVLYNVMGAL